MGAEQPPSARRAHTRNGWNGVSLQVMRLGKRVAIAVVGGIVLLAGVAMLVLPGPGMVVIPLGLAILALEFERPRIWLARLKAKGIELKQRIRERRSHSGDGS